MAKGISRVVRRRIACAMIGTFLCVPASFADAIQFDTFEVPLERMGESPMTATLKVPRKLKTGEKVPVFLVFGGFESAAQVLGLLHPHRPVALASFDYPFSASRDLKFPKGLLALPEAKRVFPRTQLGIAQLVRQLQKRPEVDADRIVIIGASFGAPFAVAAAAWTPGIKGVVLVHGFGQIPNTAEHVILKSWLPRYGWVARPPAWILSRLTWFYLGVDSPEDSARELREGQHVLMITALADSFIPRESSDSLWTALGESKAKLTRKLMPTDHLLPGSERLIDEIIVDVESWMSRW